MSSYYDISNGPPEIKANCDTMACAFGLAALDPDFQAQGLSFRVIKALRDENKGTMVPSYDGVTGMEAAAAFFGIKLSDAEYLFDPDCYESTPAGAVGELFVADRVRDFRNGIIDEEFHDDFRDDDQDDED
jgi:hypothetical protein